MVTVVHCKKDRYNVYIGRPSIFGNPFTHLKTKSLGTFLVASRDEAVSEYKKWVIKQPKVLKAIKNLPEDAILGCWCKPQACHGDVIAEIRNEQNSET
jgi:hypothetical protein